MKLKVYDVLGREVSTLVNEKKIPGNYEVTFDIGYAEQSRSITSGVYFYRLTIQPDQSNLQKFSKTKKMILLK